MTNTLNTTRFNLPGNPELYQGKVRDVYAFPNGKIALVATDRISAFDVILPKNIPYKGQVLTQIAAYFLRKTADICPNWFIDTPDPNVAVGYRCKPIKLEMVIRGYLTGHAWREYKAGKRELCGVPLPEGMIEHQRFEQPIITPATKADTGHDEDISREEILARGIVSEALYRQLEVYTRALFERGTQMAAEKNLILVDTKYEFGLYDGKPMLIDEVHTPDSSRYFYADTYQERLQKGLPQNQLSKEFVREWLIEQGFQGQPGQEIPPMTEAFVEEVSQRYISLYETITGERFMPAATDNIPERIEANLRRFLETRSED